MNERAEGMAVRRQVLGDARVDRVVADTMAESRRGGDIVKSLERGLAVIRAFDADHAELTLSEVARASALTRAAARRFLLTLVELGYVRTDGRLFALRPRVLELGYAYLSSLTPTKRIMTVAISVGTRFPAHATSMGRVLLAGQTDDWLDGYLATVKLAALTRHTITEPKLLRAELVRIRSQGWALVDQELEEGLRSVAAPIRAADGRGVAAVNLSAHASRSLTAMRAELLPHLLETADRIADDLPGRGAAVDRP